MVLIKLDHKYFEIDFKIICGSDCVSEGATLLLTKYIERESDERVWCMFDFQFVVRIAFQPTNAAKPQNTKTSFARFSLNIKESPLRSNQLP